MKLSVRKTLLTLMATLSLLTSASADPAWGWEGSYVADFFSNTGGAAPGNAFLNTLTLSASGDLGKAMGWKGGSIYLSAIANKNDSITALSGDLQGIDNIEADNASRILEAWLNQSFGSSSLLLGYYDLNSEFDSIDTAGLFINPSHGIGVDYSQTGPGLYPQTAESLRFASTWGAQGYWQLAYQVLKPDNPNGNLLALEAGHTTDNGNKWAVGLWSYDIAQTQDVAGGTIAAKTNNGMYAFWDHAMGNSSHYFIRYGVADEQLNDIGSYLGMGLVTDGVFREGSQLGLAMAMASTSSTFQSTGVGASEINIELTYRLPINEHFALQPDLQYVLSPSADPSLPSAKVLGIRFEMTY